MYPMGIGDILDTSFKLLRHTAGPSILLVLIVLGPVQVIASLAAGNPASILSDPVPAEPNYSLLVLSFGTALLQYVIGLPLVSAGLTWLAARTDEGERPDWTAAFRAGLRRFLPVLGAVLMLFLGAGAIVTVLVLLSVLAATAVGPVGGVLLGIPTFIVGVVLLLASTMGSYLVVPVIVVEERGPLVALRRLWSLVRRRFWPIVGLSLLAGLVFQLIGGAVNTPFTIAAFLPTPIGWLFLAIGGVLSEMVQVPLAAFVALAMYVDLRIRIEGYDIAVLAAELRR